MNAPRWLSLAMLLVWCGEASGSFPLPVDGGWSLVMIPDTQNYVSSTANLGIFRAETEWIAGEASAWDIRYALHVGDLVNDNSTTQWGRAVACLTPLQGIVPYALCTGNHDCGPGGNGDTRDSEFDRVEHFGVGSPYQQQATFQGNFQHPDDLPGNTQNSWHGFTVNRRNYLILTCEWGPRDAVLDWMNATVEAHPHHRVILLVHAYLESQDTRFGEGGISSGTNPHNYGIDNDPDGVNDGEDLWQKFVRRHENIFLVCCGHAGRASRVCIGDHGNRVHQLLYNTQGLANGGDGWLRLLHFYPDDRTVQAYTYSPWRDEWDRSGNDEFRFEIDPVSTTDTDLDGLPDWFEEAYGLSVVSPDASDDLDGDGWDNLAEFLARTAPDDPSDYLAISSVRRQPDGMIEIRWPSVPGLRYHLASSSTLAVDSWEEIAAPVAEEAEMVELVPWDNSRFRAFRLGVR